MEAKNCRRGLLETVSDLVTHNKGPKGLALAIAAWIKYVSGKDLNGEAIDVRDPLASEFSTIAKK